MNKKPIDILFKEEILPTIRANAEHKLHICNNCSSTEYDPYGQDTGKCDVCEKVTDVTNPFIYKAIVDKGYNPKDDWWGKAPRIYHYEHGVDEKRPSHIDFSMLSQSGAQKLSPKDIKRSWFSKIFCSCLKNTNINDKSRLQIILRKNTAD